MASKTSVAVREAKAAEDQALTLASLDARVGAIERDIRTLMDSMQALASLVATFTEKVGKKMEEAQDGNLTRKR
jgi:hypothetical protein